MSKTFNEGRVKMSKTFNDGLTHITVTQEGYAMCSYLCDTHMLKIKEITIDCHPTCLVCLREYARLDISFAHFTDWYTVAYCQVKYIKRPW
jgi:hypothetical protein